MPGADETASEAGSPPSVPFLRVVGSDATPEEIAAIVAVLASLGGGDETPARPRPEWNTPRRMHRATLPHGPGGWRSSVLPR